LIRFQGVEVNPRQSLAQSPTSPDQRATRLLFPFLDLKAEYATMKEDIRAAVDRVLESQQFIMGPEVRELEAEIAAFIGSRFAIACASGSDALLLALMALGVDAGDEIFGKRLELLKETLPNLSRVGILWNPDFAPNRSRLTSMSEATQVLGLTLVSAEARGLDVLEQAFATMVRERAQAFVVLGEPVLFGNRGQIAAMAIRERLPVIATAREYAEAGSLLTYGPNLQDQFRRSAAFVDKIFKGAKPADLPVEQPTKYELVINLKTAKALGIDVPPTLLARADEVIE